MRMKPSLCAKLSQIAKVGDTFALFGTLGMGKSVFARGFVQSLTAAEEVPSPTFTLVQSYEAPDFEIYHSTCIGSRPRKKSLNLVWKKRFTEASV